MKNQKSRITRRKLLISEVLEQLGRPVLLEELRWRCYREECASKGNCAMTESYQKSFNRTIRCHYPDLVLTKLPRVDELPSGLVTRAAVYRIPRWETISRFLSSNHACVYCKYQGKNKYRNWEHPEIRCDLFEYPCPQRSRRYGVGRNRLSIRIAAILFPISSPLSVIYYSSVTMDELKSLSDVPWKIFRSTSCIDTQLKGTQPIRTKWRSYLKYSLLDFLSKRQYGLYS
jgi:hypothetical protein